MKRMYNDYHITSNTKYISIGDTNLCDSINHQLNLLSEDPENLFIMQIADIIRNIIERSHSYTQFEYWIEMITYNSTFVTYARLNFMKFIINMFFKNSLKFNDEIFDFDTDGEKFLKYTIKYDKVTAEINQSLNCFTIINEEKFNKDFNYLIERLNNYYKFVKDLSMVQIKYNITEYIKGTIESLNKHFDCNDFSVDNVIGIKYERPFLIKDLYNSYNIQVINNKFKNKLEFITWIITSLANILAPSSKFKFPTNMNIIDFIKDYEISNPVYYMDSLYDIVWIMEMNTNHGKFIITQQKDNKDRIAYIKESKLDQKNPLKYIFNYSDQKFEDSRVESTKNTKDHFYGVAYYGDIHNFLTEISFNDHHPSCKFYDSFKFNLVNNDFKTCTKELNYNLYGAQIICQEFERSR